MAPGLTVTHGRIVEYTLSEADGVRPDVVGQQRPAMIVRVWSPEANGNGCSNLLVFLDGENDQPKPPPIEDAPVSTSLETPAELVVEQLAVTGPVLWATSRTYDPTGAAGTWRWPPRV